MTHAALALVFLLFAGFQLNDPDPHIWVSAYLLPAGVLALAARGHRWPRLEGALAVFYMGLALWMWPDEYHGLDEMRAAVPQIEWARESLGLGIVALVNAVMAVRGLPSEPRVEEP
jgi:hypothetical protein